MGAHCAPLRKKKSSAVLLFEAVAALRFSPDYPKGKGVIHKRVETVGVYPLVRPRGVSALPAEVQRKPPRPLGANTLTQFVCPAQPVQERCRPVRANRLRGSCVPLDFTLISYYTERAKYVVPTTKQEEI